jgi:hypothetical protein
MLRERHVTKFGLYVTKIGPRPKRDSRGPKSFSPMQEIQHGAESPLAFVPPCPFVKNVHKTIPHWGRPKNEHESLHDGSPPSYSWPTLLETCP